MKKYLLLFGFIALLAGCGYRQANERIDALYVQGDRYLNTDQWDSAMIVFSEAERLLNPQTDLVMRGRVYACLGYLWYNNNNLQKYLEYQEKAWQAYDKAENENLSVLTLLKIGDYYYTLRTPEGHQKALEYIERTNAYQNINDTTRGTILQYRAMAYFFANQWDSAIVYFHKAQAYPLRSSNTCINRLYLGISYLNLNQLDSAKCCVTEALTYPAKLQQRSGCYNILHRIANAEGDSAAIHHYAAILITYKDSMMRKENTLSYQATAMDDKVDALQDTKHRRRVTLITVALALVIIVALTLYTLLTRRHQQQQKDWQHQMQEAQQEHENSRNERVEQHIARLQKLHPPTPNWQDKKWEQVFRDMELQDASFFNNLLQKHPKLTKEDIRFCVLILLDYSYSEIATCLNLSESTIGQKKKRLAKKMTISIANLRDYFLNQYN